MRRAGRYLSLLAVVLFGAGEAHAAKLKSVSVLDKDYLVVHISDGDVVHHEDPSQSSTPEDTVIRYTPALSTAAAGTLTSWTLRSSQDAAYGSAGKNPSSAGRKTKLSGHAQQGWGSGDFIYESTFEHWIYLRLPTSLVQGATYTLSIGAAVNSDLTSASFTFDVNQSRSEAVHVNLVGYAPTAPHKAADLYHWMGSSGARDYSSFVGNQVSLYNVATGATTAVGTVALWMASGTDVWGYNLTRSGVWSADFSSFTTPGTYRLVIAGVGCSQDFQIANDVYANPFKLSVKGYYYMRIGEDPAGVHPPPRTPRYIPGVSPSSTVVYLTEMQPFHPEWGSFASGDKWDRTTEWDAYRLPGSPTNPNAWGGHSDAADWDRHLGHVVSIYDMLLPYILTNGALSDDAAGIRESGNGIPDIIDEARNEVDFWLRLRDQQGGYSHGLNNPTGGNVLYQAGPTAIAAWANALNAAMLADAFRIAGQATLMGQYRDAAIMAFNYANTLPDPMLDQGQDLGGMVRGRDFKMMAAAFLYNVTGTQAWEDIVNAESVCASSSTAAINNGQRNQVWGTAAYLVTPRTVHYPTLRANMKTAIIAQAKSEEANLINSRPSRRATDRGDLGYFQMAQNVDRTIIAHAVADTQADRDLFRKALALEADWGLGRNPLNALQMTAATTVLGSKRSVPESYTSGINDGVDGVHPGHTPYFNLDDWSCGMVMGCPSALYAGSYPTDVKGAWPVAEAFFPSRWVWAHTEFTPQQTMTGKMALLGYLYGLAGATGDPMLSVVKLGTGAGTVTSSPAGIACGTDCNEAYATGTSVTLTAAPGVGSTFAGWGGACSGTTTCTVSMTTARSVTATFAGSGGESSSLTIEDVSTTEGSSGVTSVTFTVTRTDSATTSYTLSVSKTGTGTGTVTSSPGGISCGSDCTEAYEPGINVTLTATPGAGSLFTGWSGACSGPGTCTVTMSAARAVTATFTPGTLNLLSVSKSGTGSGTVTSDPAGIACGAQCSASYPSTSSLTLTAAPSAGSVFESWGGACTGTSATCTLSMSAARSVTATFTSSGVPIAMIYDEGLATGWQNWSWSATLDFAGTSPVRVGARALNATIQAWGAFSPYKSTPLNTAGYASLRFWLHGGTGSNKTLSVTSEGADGESPTVSVTAVANTWSDITISLAQLGYPSSINRLNFANSSGSALSTITFDEMRFEGTTGPSYALSVSKAGTGTGTVTSSPAGIDCGSDCSESYPSGWNVTLNATVPTGSAFAGWSGACTGTGPCTVTMSAARAVTATFEPSVTYALTVTKSGTGVGAVTSSPVGIGCGADCSEAFDSGTVVTLVPSPATGSTFTGWSGACTGTGSCTVTMSAARTVGAAFGGGTTVAGALRYVGRVDARTPSAVRFAWQGAGLVATVTGTTIAVNLETTGTSTVYFQPVIDGLVGNRFEVTQGAQRIITLASGLAAGSHVVELYRETEGMYGVSVFRGFSQGTVTGAPAATGRVVEVVGDSISAGYGNLGVEPHPGWVANPACHWTAENSSWFQTYAALAGRTCGADVSTVARSGWGMYRDLSGDTSGVLSSVYENAVGTDDSYEWGFNPQASVVIVNLGTNDYAPGEPGTPYETAAVAFVQEIRARYPNAWIFLAIGSMLGDDELAAASAHLANVVTAVGDPKVVSFDLGIQDLGANGEIPSGCDWHPNVADHARMAGIIRARLQTHLGW